MRTTTKNNPVAWVGVAAVVVVAAASMWWLTVSRNTPPGGTASRKPVAAPTDDLPGAVLAELGALGQLRSAVESEAKERERHWRRRLATGAPASELEVRDQLHRSLDMLTALESLPPLDASGFAPQPPSRVWKPSGRLALRGIVQPLPPALGLEVRVGPEKTVAAHSGEFCLDEEDLVMPSRGGMGFSFRRYYRSLSEYDGPLGYGWDHNHNLRLIADAASVSEAATLTLHTGDSTIRFARDGQNWLVQRGGFLRLEVRDKGIVALTDSARTHMIFEPAVSPPDGRAAWRVQRRYTRHGVDAGNRLVYQYADGTDTLVGIEDPFGQRIAFHYDGNGRLRVVLVPGSRIEFVYDDQGRLASASIPAVARSLTEHVPSTIQYGYQQASGRHWCVSRRQNGAPTQLFVNYDLREGSSTFGEVQATGYQQISRPVERMTWQVEARVENDSRKVTVTPPTPGPRETFTFRAASDMPWLPIARSIPSRRADWVYRYNADGLCVEEKHPDGFTIRRQFDEQNTDARSRANCLDEAVTATTEPLVGALRAKGITRRFLDGTSFAVSISTYQIDYHGTRTVLKEQQNEYSMDSLDLLRTAVGDEANWYFWNRHGQLIAEVDGCGAVTLHSYLPGVPDRDMRVFVDGSSAGGGVRVRTVHDAPTADLLALLSGKDEARAGKLPRRTVPMPPASEISQFLYDRYGRKIGQKSPGHISHAFLNRVGQPLVSWDSATGLVVTQYDSILRRHRVLREFTPVAHDMATGRFRGSGLEPFACRFFTESYEYDAWGNVVAFAATDEPPQQGADRPVFRYERYPSGVLRRLIDPAGTAKVHEYDTDTGLPLRIGLVGADGEAITLRKFLNYSPSGLLLSFQDDCGDIWGTRLDSLGRAFEETRPDGVIAQTTLDGMDRPSRTVESRDGQVVNEQEWEYTPSGRTSRISRSRFRQTDDGKIVSADKVVLEENRYDAAGRLIRQRGPRADAWKQVFYDGMGRVVAEKTPEGDWWLAVYRDGVVVGRSALVRQPAADTFVALREVTLLTERFQPYVVIPVDAGGIAQWGRARVQKWSSEGQLVESLELDGVYSRVAYDTRGNRVYESVAPSRPGDKGESRHTTWRYDAAGRLVSQTVAVTPLALIRKNEAEKTVAPVLVPVPQTTEWRYDSLGRLTRYDQPDGVQVSRQYDRHGSMVARMTWRHATDSNRALRDIEFRYGPLRRLCAVLRAGEKDPIQEFKYDAWGFCTRSDDNTGHERVVVQREFDNLGCQWRERISYGAALVQDLATEDNIETGVRRLRWQYPNTMPPMFWTEASYQNDRDGRVTSLSLNGHAFCQWTYQGQVPISRTVTPSQTRRDVSLNPMGEIVGVKIDIQRGETRSGLSEMRYGLDSRGSVTWSTVRLRGVVEQPESVVSHYFDLDAYRQIIASAQEPVACPDMEARRRDLFSAGDSPAAVLANRTHRDQAGNIFARYQGRWSNSPLKTAGERGTLYSPGPALSVPHDTPAEAAHLVNMLAETDRLQLASNRLTATACQGDEQRAYKYDLLGQLSEYAGTYWDGEKAQPVFWSLTFDSLGRLMRMEAVVRDPARNKPAEGAATVAALEYAYEAGGRRIVKRAMDHATNRVRREAVLYCDDHPTVILEQHGDASWVPKQQYVWGALPAEALQVVTSPSDAGTGASRQLQCYALHQDRGMDMVFASSVVGDRVTATPLATYLDTGENASSTRIAAVRSSMPATQPEACRNGWVDDGQQAHFWAQEGWNWVELQLPEAKRVTGLTIWTDDFPNDFEVYRLDPGQQLPVGNEIEEWTRWARSEGRLVTAAVNGRFYGPSGLRRKLSLMESPFEFVLNGSRAERLVILWRDITRRARPVSVAEFSVTVMPEAVSALGQNGAWLDRETGLYYQLHRYRLPAMNGKFISPDPLGFLGGPDLYAYANNNPLQWHDPDGRFAHILWGAAGGAAVGGISYLVQCWISGEEISWKRLFIGTASGAASGAAAALTFGATSGFLAAKGFSSVTNAVITTSVTGAVTGFTGGSFTTFAEAVLLDGREVGESLQLGVAAGARGAVIGMVGGAVGGAVLSQVGASFFGSVVSGASGGAAGGSVAGAWQGYQRHGWSLDMFHHAWSGALQGAAYGAAIGAAGWVAGRASGVVRPMEDYPTELPRPPGLLVRTQPREPTYGGIPAKPGYARHHVKPLSLGGRDVPSNIRYVPLRQHRIPHPPQTVREAPLGTIFY